MHARTHKLDKSNSYVECSHTRHEVILYTIYVLKQTAYYTETTRLHYIVILDSFLRNKHIHKFAHCMS